MKIIAHIHTDFPDKFGIPRQSGLVKGLTGQIVFEPEYRNPEIVKGIDEFTHIWLLWKFSESRKEHWSARFERMLCRHPHRTAWRTRRVWAER